MTSPIIAYKFAEMQHAEYEAQASQLSPPETEAKENRQGLILGRVVTLIRQKRDQIVSQFSKHQIAEAS